MAGIGPPGQAPCSRRGRCEEQPSLTAGSEHRGRARQPSPAWTGCPLFRFPAPAGCGSITAQPFEGKRARAEGRMKAEILSIGSELTSGQNLDTNSQWLSLRLAEIGIAVGRHTTVADDLEANVAAFRLAAQRSGLVVA